MAPTPVLLSGKSHGWRTLVGCSPWGHEESDTYWATSLSLSCIGEGNGNPLQCSCLENPRDGGAWWAAICGVAQSRTWLKWLSSSSKGCEEPTHRKRRWCWEILKAGGEGDNREWDGWMASLTQWTWGWAAPGVGEGQGSLACCRPWGRKESDTTELLNNNNKGSRT